MAGQKRHSQGPYPRQTGNTVDMIREQKGAFAMHGAHDYRGTEGPGAMEHRGEGSNDAPSSRHGGPWSHEGVHGIQGEIPVDGYWADDRRSGRSPEPRDSDRWEGSSSNGRHAAGPHAGKGPRGYRRTDERLEEEINERLTRHPDIDAREIDVAVSEGDVTLSGTADSRRTRHAIEDLVEECSGVRDVENRIRVARNM